MYLSVTLFPYANGRSSDNFIAAIRRFNYHPFELLEIHVAVTYKRDHFHYDSAFSISIIE